jgi:hypothetical protein
MWEFGHRRLQLRPKVIRNIGIVLFIISFLAPHWRAGGWDDIMFFGGCWMFITAPYYALNSITESSTDPNNVGGGVQVIALIILAAWSCNFTFFLKLPRLLALASIALPWVAYACIFSFLVSFVPFYPWAFGIAFIHLSRLLKPWPQAMPKQN